MPDVPVCKEIDLRGQICPSTLLTALRETNTNKTELRSGELKLVILTDNRNSTTHISESIGAMGYRVEVVKEQEYYRITIDRIS
ncbi:TusA-related sulfurtransferase [Trichlorobacter thiogenes]|uniref:TusA-related sulfurtransferase n=1 Tax=Trichlorobacter thiogenes TaxID=115783 RepID=A0A1T4RQQ9_9BACT|nr:sulfurtransferase TusA family protein [Trichlorobacter thiogenes]SKA18272.1 TusA-related sulfurtransferase [Trichlorobacter thiogenes]